VKIGGKGRYPFGPLRERFRGCMLGLALGDALGVPFEGRREVRGDQVWRAAEERPLLRYTDDTHMAIGVAESLIKCGRFEGRHMAETFARNFKEEPWRGYGPGPPRVFEKIEAGVPWDRAAETIYPGGSFGNGAAMRVAPLGLYYCRDFKLLPEAAAQQSKITHTHPLGIEGAVLQAFAVALAALHGPIPSAGELLARLRTLTGEEIYRSKLEEMESLLGEPRASAVALRLGNGIEAFNSVPAAICCFLRHPGSFAEAVVEAVSLGGDTDTIAAMAGAIAGASLGVEKIPRGWLAKLENKDYLDQLAVRLWEAALKGADGS